MEHVGYVLDVLDLRKLQIETWVVFEACSSGGKKRFCCEVTHIVN